MLYMYLQNLNLLVDPHSHMYNGCQTLLLCKYLNQTVPSLLPQQHTQVCASVSEIDFEMKVLLCSNFRGLKLILAEIEVLFLAMWKRKYTN